MCICTAYINCKKAQHFYVFGELMVIFCEDWGWGWRDTKHTSVSFLEEEGGRQ